MNLSVSQIKNPTKTKKKTQQQKTSSNSLINRENRNKCKFYWEKVQSRAQQNLYQVQADMAFSVCKRHLLYTQREKRLRLNIPSVFGTITNCTIKTRVNCVLLIIPFLKNGMVSPECNVTQCHCDVAADLLFCHCLLSL